jgi:hypothetical protein
MFQKHFTPKDAAKLFPLVKRIVNDILVKGQRLTNIMVVYEGEGLPQEARCLTDEIEILMHELENLGCFFKDWNFEIGLVDFPAIIDGEEVFLCWRSDEADIGWYHSVEEGYASRKPLPMEWLIS